MSRQVLFLCAMLILGPALAQAAGCRADRVSLRGDWGEAEFVVELADTDQERARGLMFRKNMPAREGMLFLYDRPQPAAFWMKNTLIPLDMIFVDRSGVVTLVHENAVPGDLTPIDGGQRVFAVLEINGGLAARYGLDAGSQMQHPAFAGGPAVWPCE